MRLGDCARLRRCNVHPADLLSECPYIGLEHINKESLHLSSVGSSSDVTSTKQYFFSDDVLFGKLRPYFRKVAHPNFSGICSTDIWVFEALNAIDKRFLFYWLASWDFVNYVNSASEGTRMPRAKWDVAKTHEIQDFRLAEQKAIAHILGTLDDKIELNKKLNQTLEDLAKAIFKSWFVDFDPVRAKADGHPTGLPADISDLFPDELVDSDIGEIPRGWEVGKLLDTANITMGQSPPGDTYNENGKGLPFYQGSTDFGFRFPSLRKFCSQPKRLAKVDDVLMSIRAPVGDINRAREECCIGRGLAAICSKNSSQSWAFYRCKFLSEQLSTFNSEGTVFGAINSKDLKNLQTIIAPDAVIEYFDQIVTPMDDSIKNKTYEIETLAQLRDTLLPKLISGELRIPDAERFIATIDDAPSA